MDEKRCVRCQMVKPVEDFYQTKTKDGLHHYCIICCKERWREYTQREDSPRRVKGIREYIESEEKYCRGCSQSLPIESFRKRTERQNGRKARCKQCESEAHKRWASAKPNASRDRNLKSKYGISLEEYDMILKTQDGGCAICGRAEDTTHKNLPVDHCHNTNLVRGILCSPCNKGLGTFFDSPELLRSAAAYLERFR